MLLQALPAALRPREKLLRHGPECLADEELLALVLRTGRPGQDVLSFASELLQRCGGLAGILGLKSLKGLQNRQGLQGTQHREGQDSLKGLGLGPARLAELQAVMELARRSLGQSLSERSVFDSPTRVREYLQLHLASLPQEVFAVMFLDAQHRLITMEVLFRGTLTQTSVYPREVVKRALEHNAAAVVLAHNHPSDVAEPSNADQHLTASLKASLGLVDVRVLDHMVVTRSEVLSMAERGWV